MPDSVLFVQWFFDFEQLQTRHFRQFLLITIQRCQHSDTLAVHTESQGYLDELSSDGKTTPRAPLTRSSSFRIKCGDDGFRHVSFDVSHPSRTGDLHLASTEMPRVSHTGDHFASMSSVLNKWFFSGRYPTAAVAMNSPSASRFSSSRAQAVMRAWKRMASRLVESGMCGVAPKRHMPVATYSLATQCTTRARWVAVYNATADV